MRILAAIAVVGLLAPSTARADACPPVPGETARVAAVIDGDTVRLLDGREVRLVSALAPKAEMAPGSDEMRKLAETATKSLSNEILGREIGLAVTGKGQDRHGRLLAHAFVDGDPERWLQRETIDRGLAWGYSLNNNSRCVGLLLRREERARIARAGLWATEFGTIGDADRPRLLSGQTGRFAIVEGRVKTVGDRPKRAYLNFGKNWSEDFTVFVDRGDRERFNAAGIDLNGLEGRRVRVRGWMLDDRGPAIHLTNPEQLELVDAR